MAKRGEEGIEGRKEGKTISLTKGTEKLVKVTSFPLFGKSNMKNMISFWLHCKTKKRLLNKIHTSIFRIS